MVLFTFLHLGGITVIHIKVLDVINPTIHYILYNFMYFNGTKWRKEIQ